MDLFADQREAARRRVQPLAVRMRPATLDEFVGQEHFAGEGRLLRRLLQADRLTSAILYGPPGTGKTTLARLIAGYTRAAFVTLHAAEAGVKDVRKVIEDAHQRLTASNQRTVLFLDEIHRFNRAQQDVLLKDVEDGVLILIGATTENQFFTVNSPLISRSQVFEFKPLTPAQIDVLLRRALTDRGRGLGAMNATVDDDALRFLAERADGDARRALSALEIAVLSQQQPDEAASQPGRTESQPGGPRSESSGTGLHTVEPRQAAAETAQNAPHVTLAIAQESLQRKAVPYDAVGDAHYDIASALIKSMRGSDPDATLYWLARMLEGGEDPRFIARRIAICASEDVGNADPHAAMLAAAALQITQAVGLPECEFALAQAAVYIACAPKSNAVTLGIAAARRDVRDGLTLPVPEFLRDASYTGAKRLGRGAGYQYPHDDPRGYVPQDYLGADKRYYNPTDHGHERRLAERLRELRRLRAQAEPNQGES